jgi:apolipoprotein N-acyltransferase
LRGEIQPHQGQTPYTRWTNWPVWWLVLSLIGFFVYRRVR